MSHHLSVPPLPNPLWVLRGSTGLALLCSVTQVASGAWVLTLTFGYERVLTESYPDARDAIDRAAQLKAGLVEKGWSHVSADEQAV